MSKEIAIITTFGHVGISNPVINTANYLISRGYKIDLYMDNASESQNLVHYNSRCVKLINSNIREQPIIRDLKFYLKVFARKKRYRFIIGFDPNGLVRAGIVGLFTGTRVFFHSLELYELRNNAGIVEKIRFLINRRLEIIFAKKAELAFIQDSMRADILSVQNKINRKKVKVMYNSPMGNVLIEKQDYFRDRYSLPKNAKLVLAAGSMIFEHYIDGIIKSVDTWPDNHILILHGWFPDQEFYNSVIPDIEKRSGKIVLSPDLLDEDKKDIVFQSVDYGLVFFRPVSKNMKYSNAASGKLYNLLRVGIPVISNRNPGMKKFIDEAGFGVTVKDTKGIGSALVKIEREYDAFRESAFRTYPLYEFGSCYKSIMEEYLK